jgi:hypothetical protein
VGSHMRVDFCQVGLVDEFDDEHGSRILRLFRSPFSVLRSPFAVLRTQNVEPERRTLNIKFPSCALPYEGLACFPHGGQLSSAASGVSAVVPMSLIFGLFVPGILVPGGAGRRRMRRRAAASRPEGGLPSSDAAARERR